MLSTSREFHFLGELFLNRSRVLSEQLDPKDDKVNWLFLELDGHHYSFVYRIREPLMARYGQTFEADLSFTMIDKLSSVVKLGESYDLFRGQEPIGKVKIVSRIDKGAATTMDREG